jgi:hypothetical protein
VHVDLARGVVDAGDLEGVEVGLDDAAAGGRDLGAPKPDLVILAYYLGWAGSRSVITTSVAGISSTWDGLLYYFRNIARFHFQGVGGRLIWGSILVVLLLAVVSRVRTGKFWRSPRCGYLCLILAGQYVVLSAYPSKVFVVDYSLVPLYFLVPVAYFFDQKQRASVRVKLERSIVVVTLLLLTGVAGSRSFNALLRAAPPDERQNWRVRETMDAVLNDASRSGYNEVLVGSTPIHPYYTCENLRFYTLNGAFPEWRNGFRMPRIGYAKDAEEKRVKPGPGERTIEHLRERCYAGNLHVWVDTAESIACQRR